jgi:benzodiazapine receptor
VKRHRKWAGENARNKRKSSFEVDFRIMNIVRLLGCIGLCEAAGIFGGIFTAQSVRTWYVELNKPSFSPPNWVFGPVWVALYAMMGTALYLVWQQKDAAGGTETAIVVFLVQLVLNAFWSFIFFGLRSPFWGFVEIVVLWVSIAATIVLFWKISATAGALLIPYIFWVTFAGGLNFSLWQMNRG